MKVKLSLKIFIIVAVMVIISSVAVGVISINTFQKHFQEEIQKQLDLTEHGADLLMRNWAQTLTAEAKTLASLNRTTNALANNVHQRC